jgi:biopolymer transport protein TolR
MAEINMVPYIDVVLVLLMIFMMTAPLINQGVEIDLPQVDTEPLPPEELQTLVLEVDRDGRYYLYLLSEERLSVEATQIRQRAATILQASPQTSVVVRADASVDYGRVIYAMGLLQQAGAPRVGLATRPPEDR